ncbi:hypothetical protein PDE_07182 [Penicillium oxalicum 114-2]|uniref:Uncharacterized protein n=1 Tax=Penicillium oxalicum (strain 114-2 / CGMCC 5302) TaxID=933388 RepID=S8BBH1_PENO1|nr:hypothetical protein PDE_07182 [Penicillium oxalicum 114-2]
MIILVLPFDLDLPRDLDATRDEVSSHRQGLSRHPARLIRVDGIGVFRNTKILKLPTYPLRATSGKL